MTPWMVLTAFVAAINLTTFIALRGRWDRRVVLLGFASLLGTAAGNVIGARTGLELVQIGDFHVLAASVVAQAAMLVTDLLGHLGPARGPR
jgi:predicted aspartyl protease